MHLPFLCIVVINDARNSGSEIVFHEYMQLSWNNNTIYLLLQRENRDCLHKLGFHFEQHFTTNQNTL